MSVDANRRRTRLSPEDRRAQLLRCALSAFAEHGIARATHSHVAARAGVSIPAVYSYFRTRDDLVAATLAEVEAFLDGLLADTLARKTLPAADALMMLARLFTDSVEEQPDRIRVWLDWSTGTGSDRWPAYLEVLGRLHHAAEATIRRGQKANDIPAWIKPKAAARIFIGGGHTVALMKFEGATKKEVDAALVQLVGGATGWTRAPE